MKKIDFKNPRYVIPLICLPFILLLFYVYQSSAAKGKGLEKTEAELQSNIAQVSAEVSGKGIEDKLQAFKQRYKKGDGYTALETIELEKSEQEDLSSAYNAKEKKMLDSISAVLKSQRASLSGSTPVSANRTNYSRRASDFGPQHGGSSQKELERMLSGYQPPLIKDPAKPADPMAMFRAQMAIVDSMNKAAFAPIKPAEKAKGIINSGSFAESPPPLKVDKQSDLIRDSLTVLAQNPSPGFIQGMIDETLTGFTGSRVSIRLLSDVRIGDRVIKKGKVIYAIISGFNAQRVQLSITSIAEKGSVFPVKLEIYDLDGIKGIYVPASAYREFSRELASSSVSGVSVNSSTDQNQQLMSLLGRMFQSTTGAVNKLIRSNKAQIRYPSMIYLIDASVNH
ncbi:conjugative transposon protein TraM [bacterium]|nr:MAG: conjugative transposon protein TraM [bacterium]